MLGINIHPTQNLVPIWYQIVMGMCYFLAIPYIYYIYVLTGAWVTSVRGWHCVMKRRLSLLVITCQSFALIYYSLGNLTPPLCYLWARLGLISVWLSSAEVLCSLARSLHKNVAFQRTLGALGQSPLYVDRMKVFYPRHLRWCLESTLALQVCSGTRKGEGTCKSTSYRSRRRHVGRVLGVAVDV
jgi:hypothetical protein